MTTNEKKRENAASSQSRKQRILDAFPMDDMMPEPTRQKQSIRQSDDQPIEELIFDGSELLSEEFFMPSARTKPHEAPVAEIAVKPNEQEEISPVFAEEATEDAERFDSVQATESAVSEEPKSEPIQTKETQDGAKPRRKSKAEPESREERIITVRPHAHRPKKKNSVPFKERPWVQKTVAFAREYRQELPHNYLLFTPFLPLGVCVLLVFFRILYRIAAPTTGANIYACVAIINVIAFVPLCTVYLRHRPLLADRMGWKLPSADKLPLMCIAAIALFFGAAALTSLGAYFGITDFRYHLFTFYDIPATTSIAGILFSTVTLALIPAVTEEILCRGIIFAEYQYDNTPLALIMSALFSAVLQFDPSRLLVGLFCGFLLGTVRMVTNSLSASIIVHMLYNIACLFYEHFFGIMGNQLSEFLILFFLCAVFALISFFFLFSTAEKVCRTYAEEQKEINVDLRFSSGVALRGSLKVAFISPTLYFVLIFYFISSVFI